MTDEFRIRAAIWPGIILATRRAAMKPNVIQALEALALEREPRKVNGLSEAEGLAVIRARRRGATVAETRKAVGVTQGNLASMLGVWAFRYARLPEDEK